MTDPYQEITCISRPQHVNEVDEQGYLNANPDVRKAGMKATDHFTRHGKKEGRVQLINEQLVEQKRQIKIEKLKFKTQPTKERLNTDPCYFLNPEIIDEFGIPELPAISSHPYSDSLVKIIRENPVCRRACWVHLEHRCLRGPPCRYHHRGNRA